MNLLKTIIFIGTNKSGSSREAVKAAEKMGYFTVLFTNNMKQIQQREQYSDVHEMIMIDTQNVNKMKQEINKLKSRGNDIKSIVSFVDANVHIASILCDEFCKNYGSSKAIYVMENKEETRLALKNHSFTPKFSIINPEEKFNAKQLPSSFPLIVKSPTSTGSKDVFLAENKEQLKKHLMKLQEKNEKEAVIVEEFVEGDQYLVEVLIHNQKPLIAGIIKQEITKGKRFIITGYSVLAKTSNTLKSEIDEVINSIITSFKIKNGALHLEIRKTKNGWKLIEINPRVSGGAMNKMLFAAFGYSLVEESLKLFLGETPSLIPKHRHYVFTQYVIVSKKGILDRVTGKGRARKSQGVVEVYIKPKKGTKLTPPYSMGHRYAYVIAKGETAEEARRFAKAAANEITFHMTEE
ncbi:ATP-grasp domain-containing protein [Bacillus sp. Bva_UNVM-123]|uniref:ATP-grasp domain-containing protein n=1 Tax=Bacillus sp. Bva_UNVM-123 TaxID=2829798 RepID=UPI00391FBAD1